jgi:hypothetical protein
MGRDKKGGEHKGQMERVEKEGSTAPLSPPLHFVTSSLSPLDVPSFFPSLQPYL